MAGYEIAVNQSGDGGMSTHKGSLPRALVKRLGETAVRNMVAPEEKLTPASILARRKSKKRDKVAEALRLIQESGDTWFLSRDAAKLAGIEACSLANTLRSTKGVRFAGTGVWVFTEEPLAVEP